VGDVLVFLLGGITVTLTIGLLNVLVFQAEPVPSKHRPR
jgi:hypothetical protein